MERSYWLQTDRLLFSSWNEADSLLAVQLWGDPLVTNFICASGRFTAVITHAFTTLHAAALFAGHHPHNKASQKVLQKLGFTYLADEFYAPTGLYHPSYQLFNPSPSR